MEKKLEAIRIEISAYTASFRVPHFVSYQLTLTVPPLSTIYGLISAATGRWVVPHEIEWLAYRFAYESKVVDLEAIWTVERKKPNGSIKFVTRNVLRREFLVFPTLTLYLPPEWGEVFYRPRYQLVLGRTQDIATVKKITETSLRFVPSGEVRGVLLPLDIIFSDNIPAWLHNLPVAFTDEPLRRPLRLQVFGIVDAHRPGYIRNSKGWLAKDEQIQLIVPIYFKDWVLQGDGTSREVR